MIFFMEVIMGEKRAFQTDKAAVLGGPYSQAIIHNGLIYISGQGPIDPRHYK
jgi:2-iminobutanoate/2-iminopropanoate deaminase